MPVSDFIQNHGVPECSKRHATLKALDNIGGQDSATRPPNPFASILDGVQRCGQACGSNRWILPPWQPRGWRRRIRPPTLLASFFARTLPSQCRGRQMLAQAVMQIMPDSAAARDSAGFQQFFFQADCAPGFPAAIFLSAARPVSRKSSRAGSQNNNQQDINRQAGCWCSKSASDNPNNAVPP
jgi:hypothetical protein